MASPLHTLIASSPVCKPDLLKDIATRLQDDKGFKLSPDKKYLRQGVCPSCSKKSLWTYAETPWVVKCERITRCAYEEHAKELYPDLFDDWTERTQAAEAAKPSSLFSFQP